MQKLYIFALIKNEIYACVIMQDPFQMKIQTMSVNIYNLFLPQVVQIKILFYQLTLLQKRYKKVVFCIVRLFSQFLDKYS